MLTRKLWRDLWRMRGQALAVALVAAVGVANLVMSQATLESLKASRDRHYREHAFAHVFAQVKRAPESTSRRLADIPGVATVDTRIVTFGRATLATFPDPIRVQAVSLPEFGASRLNRLHLRSGREPLTGERDTLAVSDGFAEAHRLKPGDFLTIVLHGRRQKFRIVGVGATPEFVAQLAPATIFPDARRFAVVWMPRPALAAATDMDGAFNSAAFALQPGARSREVIAAIDAILAGYGSVGAVTRSDQPSHRYLSEEFRQLETMARIFPAVFLAVSSFVLYVVLSRLVASQREQIGTLKAFGFGPWEIWLHYAGFALLIGLLGAAIGLALGAWLGVAMAGLYREYYRLPFLDFALSPGIVLLTLATSVGSAQLGAAVPVRAAARLSTIQAMRQEVPWRGAARRSRLVDLSRFNQAHRLIARSMQQRPLRTAMTWLGLATGTAVMMIGRFQSDAIDQIVERQFQRAERYDVSLAFFEPMAPRAMHELAALPGVLAIEPERVVPVRVRYQARTYRTVLRGVPTNARLRRTIDRVGRPIRLPASGVVLTDYLAGHLGAGLGDVIELETMDGRQRVLRLPLSGVVGEPFGAQAYLPLETLDRVLGEGERVTGALLAVDGCCVDGVLDALERRPAVAGVEQRRTGIANFYEGMANTILTFTLIATGFGVVLTAGVIYSSARVALLERSRDLASLRILGFTNAEVGYLLLGELALLAVLAVPLGFLLGHGLIALLVIGYDSDLFRIPHYVSPATYGIAGVTTLLTAMACGAVIWRRIGRLDLIGVLKAHD